MTNYGHYNENMKDMKRSNSGMLKIQNKLAHPHNILKKFENNHKLGISKDQIN